MNEKDYWENIEKTKIFFCVKFVKQPKYLLKRGQGKIKKK